MQYIKIMEKFFIFDLYRLLNDSSSLFDIDEETMDPNCLNSSKG